MGISYVLLLASSCCMHSVIVSFLLFEFLDMSVFGKLEQELSINVVHQLKETNINLILR